MPFDPRIFEAEVALKLIPTEQLPLLAQDALEAGYDGTKVLRMAILDPKDGWEIDQALLPMLQELGCQTISLKEAALRLACLRAKRILDSTEDPLLSLSYFCQLREAGDYPAELDELAYIDDDYAFYSAETDEKHLYVREALQELLSPELKEKRQAERKAAWEQEQALAKREWPYVLNSQSGRDLLKNRYMEKLAEMRPLLWIELVAWGLLGWSFNSLRTAVIGFVVSLPILLALLFGGEYLKLKRERRNILLRRGIPENQI